MIHKLNPRSFWEVTRYFETLKYVAYEGSTLTFLGILKYDVQLASFTLSNVSLIVSGGAKECLKYLKEEIFELKLA